MSPTMGLRENEAETALKVLVLAGALLAALPVVSGAGESIPGKGADDTPFCETALSAAERQLAGFRQTYTGPARIPRSWQDGKVRLADPGDWTSGFVAGSFWLLYEFTQDPAWRAAAEKWTDALAEQQFNTSDHDIGFRIGSSYGNGYRLTGNPDYVPVLIRAAESLLSRFNPTVGATRSWDFGEWRFPVIVDNMMNLELLYLASAESGDPKFAEAATTHARTTLNHHYREDFSSWHVVDFDPATGEVLRRQTHQGIADDSAWARGQAWGLYGFTMAYRYTGDEDFLTRAQNIAGFLLNHPNLPPDRIPWFDYDAPNLPDFDGVRDSAAAAITASALLELAGDVPEPTATEYRAHALAILRSLASPAYSAEPGGNGHFVLMHATGNWPAGSEIDAAINYADYYYLEALLRCTGSNSNDPSPDHDQAVLSINFEAAPFGPYSDEQASADWKALEWSNLHGRAAVVEDAEQGAVLRLNYPAGGVGPAESGGQLVARLPAAVEYTLSYKVLFEPGFDFRLGGKLPGLTSGGGTWTGGKHPDHGQGWSARFMWREGGAAEVYLYYVDMQGQWGEQLPLEGVVLETGHWIELKQRIRLNSPDGRDALIEAWVDGKPVMTKSGFRLRIGEQGPIDSLYFSTFHGGNTPEWGPLDDSFIRFDDFRAEAATP